MGFSRFSSKLLPSSQRLDMAHEHYSKVANIDIKPAKEVEFFADSQIHILPGAITAVIERSPCKVRRTRAQAEAGSDDLALFINTGGHFRIEQQGARAVDFNEGEAYLSPSNVAGNSDISQHGVDVIVPRNAILPLLDKPNKVLRKKIPASPELRLLISYVNTMTLEQGEMSSEAELTAAAHIRDLLVMAIGVKKSAQSEVQSGGVRAARIKAIKADIQKNFHDHNLNAKTICVRHGISDRYLRVLFAEEQTSFSDYLLNLRLSMAQRQLSDVRKLARSISSIAFDSGFSDLSWFNRAYKRRFGIRPSESREAAMENLTR